MLHNVNELGEETWESTSELACQRLREGKGEQKITGGIRQVNELREETRTSTWKLDYKRLKGEKEKQGIFSHVSRFLHSGIERTWTNRRQCEKRPSRKNEIKK